MSSKCFLLLLMGNLLQESKFSLSQRQFCNFISAKKEQVNTHLTLLVRTSISNTTSVYGSKNRMFGWLLVLYILNDMWWAGQLRSRCERICFSDLEVPSLRFKTQV